MKKLLPLILFFFLAQAGFSQTANCSGCAKVIYIVDNSGSVSSGEFNDMKTSLDAVSANILASYPNVDISVVQYGYDMSSSAAQYNVTVPFTNNLGTVQTWGRAFPSGGDHLPGSIAAMRLNGEFDPGGQLDLVTDGCAISILVFTDAYSDFSSSILVNNGGGSIAPPAGTMPGFGEFNFLKSTYGVVFSVYHVSPNATATNTAAAIANVGGGYAGPGIDPNPGDPEGSGVLPRRYTNGPFLLTNPQIIQITLDIDPGAGGGLSFSKSKDTLCTNESVTFTSNGIPPYTLCTWDFGDGNTASNTLTPSHSYTTPGAYEVTHILHTADCEDTTTDTIIVSQAVFADFFVDTVCEGQVNNFNNSSTGPINYTSWNFGDGTNGNQTGPVFTHTYPGAGFYNVQLVVGNNGCYDTLVKVAGIQTTPVASYTFTDQCEGVDYQFNNTTTLGGATPPPGTFYVWHFGNSTTSLLENPTTSYTAAGNYNVRLVATSSAGCVDDTIQQIEVYPLPQAQFISDDVCLGFPTSFTDQSTISSGNIITWQWFTDSNYNVQNPQHIYENDGPFAMSLIVTSDHGCKDTVINTGVVYPLPVADFIYEPINLSLFNTDACFDNKSTNANSYLWNFGFNNLTSINENPCVQFPIGYKGIYPVKLIAQNQYGCLDSITVPVEVEDEFLIYVPSAFTPDGDGVNEEFMPHYSGIKEVKFYVFNRWGELLFSTEKIDESWDGKHDGEICKEDVYVYRIFATDIFGTKHEKIGHVNLLR